MRGIAALSQRGVTEPRLPAVVLTELLSLSIVSAARADVSFRMDESAWTNAVGAVVVDSSDTSAADVAPADEMAPPPGANAQLHPQFTFRAANTGLCGGIAVQALEAGAGLTHDDTDPVGNLLPGTVSIGDVGNFEDDDLRLAFWTGSFFTVCFFPVDHVEEIDRSKKPRAV